MRMSTLVPLLGLMSSTCATSTSAQGKADHSGGSGPGPEEHHGCQELAHTCAATDLLRLGNQDLSPSEIDALVKRADKGAAVVERVNGHSKLRPSCRVPGTYASYQGKTPGKTSTGRLWATNRPLLHPDEVGRDCASATHLVAAFARNAEKFEAILVPLPCPPIDDPKPAPWCLAQGLTGPERLERSIGIQDRLEPALQPLYPPRRSKASAEASQEAAARAGAPAHPAHPAHPARPGIKATTAAILEMWALAPDDYPATRWLERVEGDCALAQQGTWYTSGYRWSRDRDNPRTEAHARPPAPQLQPGRLSSTTCLAWPVFLDCFPGLVELEPGCLHAYY